MRYEGKRLTASLQTEREKRVPATNATGEVGLDFGAKTTIMPSTGPSPPGMFLHSARSAWAWSAWQGRKR